MNIEELLKKLREYLKPYMPKGSELEINIKLTIPNKNKIKNIDNRKVEDKK